MHKTLAFRLRKQETPWLPLSEHVYHFLDIYVFIFNIFSKGLVSSTHILQGIFSTWKKEKLCLPGAKEIPG